MIIFLIIMLIITVLILFYTLYFLRDPERTIPFGSNVVSPADGKVVMIRKYDEDLVEVDKSYLGMVETRTKDVSKEGYIVSIFMSIFDVHVNRSPIAGTIKYAKYNPGKFSHAKKEKSTFENENVQILLKDGSLKLKVILIAGFLARRIVLFTKENDKLIKGQRFGMIRLGSQVTLILPSSLKLKVLEGQKVIAGETIIAEK